MSDNQCMDHQRPWKGNPGMVDYCQKRQGHSGPPRYPPSKKEAKPDA